jgi:hypothetical protein
MVRQPGLDALAGPEEGHVAPSLVSASFDSISPRQRAAFGEALVQWYDPDRRPFP